jgi:hypothetical protein
VQLSLGLAPLERCATPRDEMPSCGCDGHISRRDTATLCVVLLLVALHLGFGYLWLHNYRSHVETTGVEG